jgi:hypothetical protein
MQRRFDQMRRRQPVAQWGFLRPHNRQVDEEDRLRDHIREHPRLQREYRSSLVLQLVVLGLLTLSCLILLVQSFRILTSVTLPGNYASLGWALPLFIGLLGMTALRRFLKVLAELRRSGQH